MSTPDQPASPWGDAPRPPAYGQQPPAQYGQGQYGQGQYGGGPAQPSGTAPSGPPQPGPYGASATKPGIIPLRPLTLGENFDGAFSAVRHNPAAVLGLSTVVITIATLAAVLLGQFVAPLLSVFLNEVFAADPDFAELAPEANVFAQVFAVTGVLSFTLLFAQPIAEAIITVSVSQSVIGRKAPAGEVWRRIRPRIPVLLGWMLLRTVGIYVVAFAVIAVLVLLVAGIGVGTDSVGLAVVVFLLGGLGAVALFAWLWTRLLLVAPALVLEGQGLGRTIGRSWRLTRGNFWRILGTALLASIIASIAGQVVGVPLGLVGVLIDGAATVGWGFVLSSIIAGVIATMVYLIFVGGVVALLYTDVRMRREGLDVQLAAAAERAAAHDGRPGPGL